MRFERTSGFPQSDYTVFGGQSSRFHERSVQSRCLEVPPTRTQSGAMQGLLSFVSSFRDGGDESCIVNAPLPLDPPSLKSCSFFLVSPFPCRLTMTLEQKKEFARREGTGVANRVLWRWRLRRRLSLHPYVRCSVCIYIPRLPQKKPDPHSVSVHTSLRVHVASSMRMAPESNESAFSCL